MIFDGEQLTDLMEPLGLGWRERRERELALMADPRPAPEQAGPRQGYLGTQRLRARGRAMTADKPSPFVPKLRFPEFAQGCIALGYKTRLGELVDMITRWPIAQLGRISTYLADGRFPIINQSRSYICGWTNDDDAVITRPLPVIVFGDHTCVLKFVNRPFAQGADGVKILRGRRRVSTLYLYHQLTYQDRW